MKVFSGMGSHTCTLSLLPGEPGQTGKNTVLLTTGSGPRVLLIGIVTGPQVLEPTAKGD